MVRSVLAEADQEPRRQRVVERLNEVDAILGLHRTDVPQRDVVGLRAEVWQRLALEMDTPAERTKAWRRALGGLFSLPSTDHDVRSAELLGYAAVDCCEDNYCDLSPAERSRILREARSVIDDVMKSSEGSDKSRLLTRKASILRYLAVHEVATERLPHLDTALRCAELAINTDATGPALLELGFCQWRSATEQKTDEAYARRLRNAENTLLDPAVLQLHAGVFGLSRFYRLTFRPLQACERFPVLLEKAGSYRRWLREAHILGEAATMLHASGYPFEDVVMYLDAASRLLEEALTAGYQNTRNILALAFVRALRYDEKSGTTVLVDLCRDRSVDWNAALRFLFEKSNYLAEAEQAFVLGITEAASLTRLGTYCYDILGDHDLAGVLYETAVRLNDRDPVALTNLARYIVRTDPQRHREAKRLLDKAERRADRRFTWWRSVLAEVQSNLPAPLPQPRSSKEFRPRYGLLANMSDVRRRWRDLLNSENEQMRGYMFEDLLAQVALLTGAVVVPSYKEKVAESFYKQIDGFFELDRVGYRFEARWRRERFSADDLTIFSGRLRVAGVHGLVFSMGGYDENAVSEARALRHEKVILLVLPEELHDVMEGRLRFDELINAKRVHMQARGEPMVRISPPRLGM